MEHNSYNAPLKLTDTTASTLWIDLCLTKEVFEILLMYHPAKNGCWPAFITDKLVWTSKFSRRQELVAQLSLDWKRWFHRVQRKFEGEKQTKTKKKMQVSLRRLSVIEVAYHGFLKSVYHYHCSLICFRRPSCLMEKACLSFFLSSVWDWVIWQHWIRENIYARL